MGAWRWHSPAPRAHLFLLNRHIVRNLAQNAYYIQQNMLLNLLGTKHAPLTSLNVEQKLDKSSLYWLS
ncbi:hypothetical protein Krac_1294 [Ktedonobacter racemifer DSM 44963]|uniref:Uncharacterized protein n=1 Tax=Ktedonobacter racemifer DSM 44963 TaxID=485913 RepID=D6U6R7_KTERA|nr:hypothetical protein Krac_1294 [Ktedonobacter racemifer DSM 44963]